MPNLIPTDTAQTERTFRQCAKDPVGTAYHEEHFYVGDKFVTFKIARGNESLIAWVAFNDPVAVKSALARGPVVHNGLVFGRIAEGRLVPAPITSIPTSTTDRLFGWSYDGFGDMPFSALKAGGYRPNEVKEWGVKDVYADSIEEVRRIVGLKKIVTTEEARPVPKGIKNVLRKILVLPMRFILSSLDSGPNAGQMIVSGIGDRYFERPVEGKYFETSGVRILVTQVAVTSLPGGDSHIRVAGIRDNVVKSLGDVSEETRKTLFDYRPLMAKGSPVPATKKPRKILALETDNNQPRKMP